MRKKKPASTAGPIGDGWYRAKDGSLTNLKSAQEIEVIVIDGIANLVASFSDGGEAVLGAWQEEEDAWKALDRIEAALIQSHKIATTRIRFGHG